MIIISLKAYKIVGEKKNTPQIINFAIITLIYTKKYYIIIIVFPEYVVLLRI